jgi:hypothetical protein
MKVFVAFGYNERDSWIESTVFPMIEAFGSEPVHGKNLGGEELTDAIKRLIDNSDALIAFATRREEGKEGKWHTHPWVRDELNYALGLKKHALEVRETGVPELGGMTGLDRQYVLFDEKQRMQCLIDVMQAIGVWHRRTTERFQVLPDEKLRPHVSNPCSYSIIEDDGIVESGQAQVFDIEGGLFVHVPRLSRKSLLKLTMGPYSSPYTSAQAIALWLQAAE